MISYCLVSPVFTPPVRILRKGRVYTIGRDPSCDFPMPSEVVSRRHAEIEWAPKGGFIVRDLGSKNGTLVNGDRVEGQRQLRDGDKLWIGPFSLQYREYQGDISDLLSEGGLDADQTLALSRDALVPPTGGFAGKFAGQELLEICSLLALNEKDGTLAVTGEGRQGTILFRRGMIAGAETEGLAGAESAALALLSLPAGRFEFVGGKVEAIGKTHLNTASIVMEAARRRDEGSETARLDQRR